MSFINVQLQRSDAQLGRFHLSTRRDWIAASSQSFDATATVPSTDRLEKSIVRISNASADGKILAVDHLAAALQEAKDSAHTPPPPSRSFKVHGAGLTPAQKYHQELQWILVGKVAVQVHGWLLTLFLNEIAPVMEDIYYWDGVLGSWRYSALYMVQKFPEKFLHTARAVLADAKGQFDEMQAEDAGALQGLAHRWQRFYGLVRQQARLRTIREYQFRIASPLNMARQDARSRLQGLYKQKEMCATGLGVLASESMSFEINPHSTDELSSEVEDWKLTVARSVRLMSSALIYVTNHDLETSEYEDRILDVTSYKAPNTDDVSNVITALGQILGDSYPEHSVEYHRRREAFGKPSRLVRYWLPALLLTLSSSTILRIVVARRAAIITWIQELGQTSIDFWYNWVVEPVKRLIGTIRHDESSEIALMSRESLEGDRASLERMVVDFAIENPDNKSAGSLTEGQIEQIRDKVKAGDLTPVLKAYENDLKRPFVGAVAGNLIRELLIQIQKTKVDVEVAISGIDSLLKSQELVFGFVSLTPGVIVCVALGRWLSGVLGGRQGRTLDKQQTRLIRILRNIDCILTEAEPQPDSRHLTYTDHGLILCEVRYLQATAEKILPGDIYPEFLQDLESLIDIRQGIDRHIRVAERLRWAYWKWLK